MCLSQCKPNYNRLALSMLRAGALLLCIARSSVLDSHLYIDMQVASFLDADLGPFVRPLEDPTSVCDLAQAYRRILRTLERYLQQYQCGRINGKNSRPNA